MTALDVLGLGVEPGAHRGRADVLLGEALGRVQDPAVRPLDGQRVGGELLAQADGHRVLHVRAAGLEHAIEGDARAPRTRPPARRAPAAARAIRSSVATRIAVGKTSLVDWAMLTWSLGLTTE